MKKEHKLTLVLAAILIFEAGLLLGVIMGVSIYKHRMAAVTPTTTSKRLPTLTYEQAGELQYFREGMSPPRDYAGTSPDNDSGLNHESSEPAETKSEAASGSD